MIQYLIYVRMKILKFYINRISYYTEITYDFMNLIEIEKRSAVVSLYIINIFLLSCHESQVMKAM